MYTAFIIMMTLEGPIKAVDNRGPYVSENLCLDRVSEMVVEISDIYRDYGNGQIQVKGFCEKDDSSVI